MYIVMNYEVKFFNRIFVCEKEITSVLCSR